jgi:hypothetical protein
MTAPNDELRSRGYAGQTIAVSGEHRRSHLLEKTIYTGVMLVADKQAALKPALEDERLRMANWEWKRKVENRRSVAS